MIARGWVFLELGADTIVNPDDIAAALTHDDGIRIILRSGVEVLVEDATLEDLDQRLRTAAQQQLMGPLDPTTWTQPTEVRP